MDSPKFRHASLRAALLFLALIAAIAVAFGPAAPAAESASSFELTLRGTRSVVVQTLGVSLVALAVGLLWGTIAGGGPALVDALLARAIELTQALPAVVILALVMAAHPTHAALAFVVVAGILRGLELARLVRGEVLRVSEEQFVLSARALGAPTASLFRRHILPHTLGPVAVNLAFGAAGVVALQAALGIFGLLPGAGWGVLIGHGVRARDASAMFWPAFSIVLTTGALYVLAEAVDDARSPFRRGKIPETWRKTWFVPK